MDQNFETPNILESIYWIKEKNAFQTVPETIQNTLLRYFKTHFLVFLG